MTLTRMRLIFVFLLYSVFPLAPLSAAPPPEQKPFPDDKVVLRIGEVKLTAREVEQFLEALPPTHRPFYSGPGRRQAADLLINTKLLVKEARKRQLDKRPDVQLKIEIAAESILHKAALDELQKDIKVTDEDLAKYLESNRFRFEEAHARRIVVRYNTGFPWEQGRPPAELPSESEARAKAEKIHRELKEGADFEEMAAKFSDDYTTSGKGGDLGYIRRGTKAHLIVPPLEQAIFTMKAGEISDIIATPLGFEIAKLEDIRVPKIDDIRGELEQQFLAHKSEEILNGMKSQEKIVVDEEFFKPGAMVSQTLKR
ncbi:MAG: peptidylprolyl isomerase [Acidobacteriota bacterium]